MSSALSYLLLDLDGCISGGKGTSFDLELMQQLKIKIAQASFTTVACTGRSAAYVEVVAQMLDLNDWCICENGSYLYHPVTETFRFHPAITTVTRQQLFDLQSTLHRRQANPDDVFAQINIEYGKELCVSLNQPNWSIARLLETVKREIDTTGLHIGHSATTIDITPQSIDKGSGVQFLSEMLGVPLFEFAGIGDSSGDIPTFHLVGTCACPNNASAELKNIADFIAPSIELQGVLEILDWLVI